MVLLAVLSILLAIDHLTGGAFAPIILNGFSQGWVCSYRV